MIDDVMPELAVLGAALIGKGGHDGVLALQPNDFQSPKNEIIHSAMKAMILRGDTPDPITLSAELEGRGQLYGPNSAGGSLYLHELVGVVPVADNGWYYARIVREATRVRLAKDAATRLANSMTNQTASEFIGECLARHSADLEAIPDALDEDQSEIPTINDLFEKQFEHRWLIKDLLHRRERVVLTAFEGTGKSVTLSTWACALAAGLHPYTGEGIGDGLRVLLVDTENDEEETQHRFRWIGDRINQLGGEPGWAKRIFQQIRPEGLDLAGKDREWFQRVVSNTAPDLIVMGPAYKLMGAAKTSDDASILAWFAAMDVVRVKHDVAMIIEAHSGHAKDEDGARSVRPFGSSVWLRWPQVGIGLRRNKEFDPGREHPEVVDVVHWRGSRGVRDWPDILKRGRDGEMPWTPFRDDYGK